MVVLGLRDFVSFFFFLVSFSHFCTTFLWEASFSLRGWEVCFLPANPEAQALAEENVGWLLFYIYAAKNTHRP